MSVLQEAGVEWFGNRGDNTCPEAASLSFMLSCHAKSVHSCPYFDIVSCKETSLMLLLRGGIVGGGEGGRAEENRLSVMMNEVVC